LNYIVFLLQNGENIDMQANCTFQNNFIFKPEDYSVLIIEDSKVLNKAISKILEMQGFKLFKTFSLQEADEILQTQQVHYILLDIILPDGNGYDLIEQLQGKDQKIIVLTTENDQQFRDVAYQKGIIDFIVKDKSFAYKVKHIQDTIKLLEYNKFKTILIIDDSIFIQRQLHALLSNRNYNTITLSDTQSAIEIIATRKIDLILLDVNLKDGDGIEFLEKNRMQIIDIEKIPVMVISGSIETATIRNALKAGAVDVLKKPYVTEEILLKVDLWIDYKRKNDEIVCSQKLLQEYKNAVDESSIVSKTNAKGIITYVNERFCKLSGYSQEELIGKQHNIVRHPDMPKEIFADMWHTIKELKKPWKGKVKNLVKGGLDYYWVDAFITPIINANGDIEEFIGLRYDITELENYKEILKTQLSDTSKSLKENIKYTAQYEDAINQFTAVLKTDTNNIITYANDEFCTISGYSSQELIGMSCKDLRDISHVANEDCSKIAKKLQNGETVTIQFTNRTKSDAIYYVDTIVYPIFDSQETLKEHLHLMHDVTSIIKLHQEIEDTQKDIVYKMGEIGESRSKETGNHVKRVALYSKILAELYGLSEKEADILFTSSPMHDIGKVAIADSILKKPAKLTDEEFEIMKTHTSIGYEILKDSKREILQAAAIVSHQHHEKWDGSGYPQKLRGEEIHIYGRITAIADVFDALGSERCYKKAWEDPKIFALFIEERGKHFDPKLTDLFLENKEKFLAIRDRYKD